MSSVFCLSHIYDIVSWKKDHFRNSKYYLFLPVNTSCQQSPAFTLLLCICKPFSGAHSINLEKVQLHFLKNLKSTFSPNFLTFWNIGSVISFEPSQVFKLNYLSGLKGKTFVFS